MKLIDSFRIRSREFLNPYFGFFRRYFLSRNGGSISFTIISNNCWGGHVSRYFSIGYNSPTVGMYFFTPEYIKFLSNLHYYLSQPLYFISLNESRYKDQLKLYGGKNTTCPIGKLGDVECVFLHYVSQEEAKEKWDRRVNRVDYNNLYIKMSEQNLCSYEDLQLFENLPYKNKFVFVHKDYKLDSQIIFTDFADDDIVKDDTTYFRRHINLINWLSGKPFKKKQTLKQYAKN